MSEEMMLVKVSAAVNSNKFYHVTLTDDGRVVSRWGRVGTQGTQTVISGGKIAYTRLVNSKMRKGYNKVDVVTDQSVSPQPAAQLRNVAHSSLIRDEGAKNETLEALIDRLVAVNRHEIFEASGGMIKVNTEGVMTTPLGLVSLSSIERADQILDQIKKNTSAPVELIEQYLSLIPQKVSHGRGWHTSFFKDKQSIEKQKNFLQQLKDSYAWTNAEKDAKAKADQEGDITEKYKDLFRYSIRQVDDESTIEEISKFYQRSRNSMHAAARLSLKNVFVLHDPQGEDTYKNVLSEIGNEKRLWHGTRAFNVLSILRKGLFVPPMRGTSFVTTGRMFGDGVYFSDQSTKSLNYAYGHAPGMINVGGTSGRDSCFMFLADVAMGWEFQPNQQGVSIFNNAALNRAHTGSDDNGRSFNSISVKGGTCGVRNNEMIVWEPKQVNVRYLCEFAT